MPTPHDDEPAEGTYTLADLQAMAAAGEIEIVEPGSPEADTFDREMVDQLDEYNRELVAREGPDAMTSDRELRVAALAAEHDPRYVAHALAAYRERIGLNPAGLAQWLGIGTGRLAALAIQPRPDPAAAKFVDRVRELAERYGADVGRLADVLG